MNNTRSPQLPPGLRQHTRSQRTRIHEPQQINHDRLADHSKLTNAERIKRVILAPAEKLNNLQLAR